MLKFVKELHLRPDLDLQRIVNYFCSRYCVSYILTTVNEFMIVQGKSLSSKKAGIQASAQERDLLVIGTAKVLKNLCSNEHVWCEDLCNKK